jgi:hypothetical protein
MALGRYGLSKLDVGGFEVHVDSGKIARGTGPLLWEVEAAGASQEALDELAARFAAAHKGTDLKFTDDQGASHHVKHCKLHKLTAADSGLHLTDGTLRFIFEGSID